MNDKSYKTSIGKDFNKKNIKNILTNKRYIVIYTYNGANTIDSIPIIIDVEKCFDHSQCSFVGNLALPFSD